MRSCLEDLHGNASSLHREGQRARAAVERAREQVAALVKARPDEVVFVSGGTEGDHLGLVGGAWAQCELGRRVAISATQHHARHGATGGVLLGLVGGAWAQCDLGGRVAISAIEHHAVHGAAEVLGELGFAIDHLPVTADGVLDLASLDRLAPGTVMVAAMLANNETGVLQPVAEAAARAHRAGARLLCDAVQAVGKVPVDAKALDADYLVLSGHKIGGPKGVGALVQRRGAPLSPLFRGSGHEAGRRGGTENVPGIVGLGVAAECAARDLAPEGARLAGLRAQLESAIRAAAPDAVIHGSATDRKSTRLNSSHLGISYAVFCLKKKKKNNYDMLRKQ